MKVDSGLPNVTRPSGHREDEHVLRQDASIGDEYISLTFHESGSDESEEEDDSKEDSDEHSEEEENVDIQVHM